MKKPRYPDAGPGRTKSVTYAYVGRFADGRLGWMMPQFLDGCRDRAQVSHIEVMKAEPRSHYPDHRLDFELCRITVELIPGRRQRHLASARETRLRKRTALT